MKHKMNHWSAIIIAALAVFSFSCNSSREHLSDSVNPLLGTDSEYALSNGNTYPAIALPWGMNFWTPQTGETGDGWQYTYKDTVIRGFKQTHQPSPWINDYGCFSIMPVTGDLNVKEKERVSLFSHERETAKPYYYQVFLDDHKTGAEVTSTERGAVFRFSYPGNEKSYLVIDGYPGGSAVTIDTVNNRIYGHSAYYAPNNKAKLPDNFANYWVIQLPGDLAGYGCWSDKGVEEGELETEGDHVGAYVLFDCSKETEKEVKVASSFISAEQAVINLEREIGERGFDEIKQLAQETWNETLQRIEIKGATVDQKKTFYSALYHFYLFPRKIYEFDSDHNMVHYSPFTGKIHNGPLYADNGFWDTFRAVHPLYTVLEPGFSNEFIEGLLNTYQEGGWLPEWFSPGYKDCMIGQHSAAVIIDAYLKGIDDYNVDLAWEAIEKGANNEGPIEALGRDGVHFYDEYGYIPFDVGVSESVSKTMEYAYNDYCIYRFARELSKPDSVTEKYYKRAHFYENVFDRELNFVRPRDKEGNWLEPFYPDNWGRAFTEGSSWHYTWSVFHDVKGLAKLMGGKNELEEKLDAMLEAEPTFRRIGYERKVIHEMTEMVLCEMGQYAHGNQPAQHALYLYNYAGAPYKAQKNIRHVMNTLYHSGPDGLCGDEDNGQTSAWYVFGALGFYPVCPGSGEYIIGSPLFEEAKITLENGNTFTVLANNNNEETPYIQSATLNGKELKRCFITHEEIMAGGVLEFDMGSKPNKEWLKNSEEAPFSLSSMKKS